MVSSDAEKPSIASLPASEPDEPRIIEQIIRNFSYASAVFVVSSILGKAAEILPPGRQTKILTATLSTAIASPRAIFVSSGESFPGDLIQQARSFFRVDSFTAAVSVAIGIAIVRKLDVPWIFKAFVVPMIGCVGLWLLLATLYLAGAIFGDRFETVQLRTYLSALLPLPTFFAMRRSVKEITTLPA